MSKKYLTVFILLLIPGLCLLGKPHNLKDTLYNTTYQKIRLKVDPRERYINGEVSIHFSIKQDTITQIELSLSDSLRVDSILHRNKKTYFVHHSDKLQVNSYSETYHLIDSITIFYQGIPKKTKEKFFYDTTTIMGTPLIFTLSEPWGTSEWLPSKIGLNDKVDSLDLWVEVPSNNKVAGNGLLISEQINGNTKTVHWKHRYPIEAYLIAFAITEYASYSDTVMLSEGPLEILNYVFPESLNEAKQNTIKLVPVFQWLDSLLIPYPFQHEKYGHAQIMVRGAMEHQTMTFTGFFSLELLTHELAHQWFGNYITCASWNDIWLNEGFATYFAALAYERGFFNKSFVSLLDRYINTVTSDFGGSVYVPDTLTNNESRIFDHRLSYEKGALLLHMLRWTIGDQLFFEGIRNYLNDPSLAHSYAKVSDFRSHLEKVSSLELNEFFNDWYYGEGFPIYTIQWHQSNNDKADFCLFQFPSHHSVSFFEMDVPIQFVGEGQDTNIVFKHTFSGEQFSINPNFKVSEIIIDPNRWLCTYHDTIRITKPINENLVHLFPNPAQQTLKIEVPLSSVIIEISVFNLLGIKQEIAIHTISPHLYELDISSLPAGIYNAYIQVSGSIIERHFIRL